VLGARCCASHFLALEESERLFRRADGDRDLALNLSAALTSAHDVDFTRSSIEVWEEAT
jgi:hypothetical protein